MTYRSKASNELYSILQQQSCTIKGSGVFGNLVRKSKLGRLAPLRYFFLKSGGIFEFSAIGYIRVQTIKANGVKFHIKFVMTFGVYTDRKLGSNYK